MEFIFSLTASIAAILFGIIATLSEYKDKNGKVKSSAIWVIAGIACSAALGLVANQLSSSSAASKTSQRHESLLRSLWENQNKIEATSIKVLFNITYASGVVEPAPPFIFKNSWICKINGKRSDSTRLFKEGKKTIWREYELLSKPNFSLKGNIMEIDRNVKKTIDDNQYAQTNYVTEFTITGENTSHWTDSFGIVTNWNNLSLELILESTYDNDFIIWHNIINKGDWGTSRSDFWKKQFQKMYDVGEYKDMPDFSILPLPCEIEATIYIGNHDLKNITAIPAEIRIYDEDVSRKIVARFPTVYLPPNYFPGFSPAVNNLPAPESNNLLLLLPGCCFLVIIVVSLLIAVLKYRHLTAD